MEAIDELVPLTAEDLKILEAAKISSSYGCGIFAIIVFVLLALLGLYNFSSSYLWFFVFVGVSILFLIVGFLAFVKVDDKNVVLDIQEGKKRRIVAPIESKDITEAQTRSDRRYNRRPTLANQFGKSLAPLNFNYSMTVQGFKFAISENQYLGGAKKGDFVEFFVAPNSKIILSSPVEVQE